MIYGYISTEHSRHPLLLCLTGEAFEIKGVKFAKTCRTIIPKELLGNTTPTAVRLFQARQAVRIEDEPDRYMNGACRGDSCFKMSIPPWLIVSCHTTLN